SCAPAAPQAATRPRNDSNSLRRIGSGRYPRRSPGASADRRSDRPARKSRTRRVVTCGKALLLRRLAERGRAAAAAGLAQVPERRLERLLAAALDRDIEGL